MTAADRVLAVVSELFQGEAPLRIRAWDGSVAGPIGAPTVVLRSPRALRRLLWSPGERGLARAYVTGELDVEGDLGDGLRRIRSVAAARGLAARPGVAVLARSLARLARLGVLGPPLARPAAEAQQRGRLHSRRRDEAAIAHHYDLSNQLYEMLLDENMAYSCGYWTSSAPDYSLADAQRDKLDLICRKLGLRPGMRLLDVGCGWGSLTVHAAANYGVHVTGVTLSREQLAYAGARVRAAGLAERVELRLQDYRDVADGPYDAAASVEMGEHVGARNYPVFLDTLHRLLRPTGRLLIQQMSHGPDAPGGGPFIESYIAPDMHMRPVGETVGLIEAAGFEVRDVHAMREHYVRTVEVWHQTFERRYADVVALLGEEWARVWRLYLVGGALAFEQNRMGVDQILAVRPDPVGLSAMPATRDDGEPARRDAGAIAGAAR